MDLIKKFDERIRQINDALNKTLSNGEPKILYDAARHLPLAGGKRLRPLFVMLSAESVGGKGEDSLPFGLAVEIVHNFTLVHDDIMDKSSLRRGLETVHIKFGEPTAIIAGDLLFAKAFEVLYELKVEPVVFKKLNYVLIKSVEEICDGQQLDMEFEKRKMVSEEEYLSMIEKKTASLFSCATTGGAIIGGGNEKQVDALKRYGKFFGLAFQIWDDYLDLCGKEEEVGKDIGNDLRNGKKTLIVAHALSNADEKEKKILSSVLGNKRATHEDIKRAVEILSNIGSIEYARKKAERYSETAKSVLDDVLRDSDSKNVLKELAEYAISRRR
ncbi:MAG: polyprenyl synthetase family protein [Thermoplasmata archaeon]|nr:polyprenyl synthetase family protein [Thermoplasmata archaeon]